MPYSIPLCTIAKNDRSPNHLHINTHSLLKLLQIMVQSFPKLLFIPQSYSKLHLCHQTYPTNCSSLYIICIHSNLVIHPAFFYSFPILPRPFNRTFIKSYPYSVSIFIYMPFLGSNKHKFFYFLSNI